MIGLHCRPRQTAFPGCPLRYTAGVRALPRIIGHRGASAHEPENSLAAFRRAIALGASGVAVLLAEQVDTSFRRVDEVRATAPMPVLSAIPRITTEQDRYRQLRQRRWATAAVAVGLFVVAGTSFLVAHNNQSMVALLMPAQPTTTPGR